MRKRYIEDNYPYNKKINKKIISINEVKEGEIICSEPAMCTHIGLKCIGDEGKYKIFVSGKKCKIKKNVICEGWYDGLYHVNPQEIERLEEGKYDKEGYDKDGFDKEGYDRN